MVGMNEAQYPHGYMDCALAPRRDAHCENDGLCCHDASDAFECPWERGEYQWVGDRLDIVSKFKRDHKEPCLAHEANNQDLVDSGFTKAQMLEAWGADPLAGDPDDKVSERRL
jgi:hypothetical protein